jgi:hypothetical protein
VAEERVHQRAQLSRPLAVSRGAPVRARRGVVRHEPAQHGAARVHQAREDLEVLAARVARHLEEPLQRLEGRRAVGGVGTGDGHEHHAAVVAVRREREPVVAFCCRRDERGSGANKQASKHASERESERCVGSVSVGGGGIRRRRKSARTAGGGREPAFCRCQGAERRCWACPCNMRRVVVRVRALRGGRARVRTRTHRVTSTNGRQESWLSNTARHESSGSSTPSSASFLNSSTSWAVAPRLSPRLTSPRAVVWKLAITRLKLSS